MVIVLPYFFESPLIFFEITADIRKKTRKFCTNILFIKNSPSDDIRQNFDNAILLRPRFAISTILVLFF